MARVTIRPLRQDDEREADRIFRLAFGTFLRLPDPLAFGGDAEYVRPRRRASPESAFAAEVDGVLVGSNFATRWGSVGFFGPLSVHPRHWDGGVAHALLAPVMECFARWGTTLTGLFTFAESPKHVHLYEKFGFQARFLTTLTAKAPVAAAAPGGWTTWSSVPPAERPAVRAAGAALTATLWLGLDVGAEIEAVDALGLGDTVLVREGGRLVGLALCHVGAGSEAGSGTCYLKFAAVAPGPGAAQRFERLLDACETFARERGLATVVAGVNTARREARRALVRRGFRTVFQGVAMHRDDVAGYSRPGIFALDDWR